MSNLGSGFKPRTAARASNRAQHGDDYADDHVDTATAAISIGMWNQDFKTAACARYCGVPWLVLTRCTAWHCTPLGAPALERCTPQGKQ